MKRTMARLALPLMLLFLMATLSSCIVRTRSHGHHRSDVRHKHSHCHERGNKRDHRKHKRDHRKKKKCHSHVHGHPHH